MKTIKQFLSTHKVRSTGFPAIAGLGQYSTGDKPALLSSLSPSILHTQGVTEYYALQIPRGSAFNAPQDIIDADLPVKRYTIDTVDANGLDVVIASQHVGTQDILLSLYPNAQVFASVTADDIDGKHVVGTLPPHLITEVAAYTAVTIDNYNYVVDGDLSGQELQNRLRIADQPIIVKEI